MQNVLSFGECLRRILNDREISVSEMSRILKMKSATSLSRVLHDEVSIKSVEKIYTQLCDSPMLDLSADERMQLRIAAKAARFGPDTVQAYRAMWDICFPPKPEEKSLSITVHGASFFPTSPTPSSLIQYYSRCRKVSMTIVGCCSLFFLSQLEPLLRKGGEMPVTITHYLHKPCKSSFEIAEQIRSIRPLFVYPNYNAFIGSQNDLSEDTLGLFESNFFLVRAVEAQGRVRLHHGILIEPGKLIITECQDQSTFSFLLHALHCVRPKPVSVKTLFPSCTTPQDYLRYTEKYLDMENGKAIYSLIPDLPINLLNPDICIAAALDGFAQTDFAPQENISELGSRFYEVQQKRWKNMFEAKKVRHYIFSAEAMTRFAQTGLQSDHFLAMRPLKPDERKAVLETLRKNMIANPYFNLYFSKDENMKFDCELTAYEGLGLLMLNARTSYKLGQDHSEVFIEQDQFCSLFISFFRNELLTHHVLSSKESLSMLDCIIAAVPEE